MMIPINLSQLGVISKTFGREMLIATLTASGGILTNRSSSFWQAAIMFSNFFDERSLKKILFTYPGSPLLAKQRKNKDETQEILDKRDAVADSLTLLLHYYAGRKPPESQKELVRQSAEAIADLVEEYVNTDDD